MRPIIHARLSRGVAFFCWALSVQCHPLYSHATAESPRSAPIQWSELGAKAGAQYAGAGLSVEATASGARVSCVLQRLEGEVTREGLWLSSTATGESGGRFSVKAVAILRQDSGGQTLGRTLSKPRLGAASPSSCAEVGPLEGEPLVSRQGASLNPDPMRGQFSLAPTGIIQVQSGLVRLVRPGVVEEYSVSGDGVRQDFVIGERPAGEGDLRLVLAVTGAAVAPAVEGVMLTVDGAHRKLAYARLKALDAGGRELAARMAPDGTQIAIFVDDHEAQYPIRIDPTFTDDNWISMGGLSGANGYVSAVAFSGGHLYIGGGFTVVGDVVANHIAKWDGSAWSTLGSGLEGDYGEYVLALAVDGLGNLYAGGGFTTAGGNTNCNLIAKWDGNAWTNLGSGMNGYVLALAVGTDSGALYAGGSFTTAGENTNCNRIAKWHGTEWANLGAGMDGSVLALAVDGASNLYAGGGFTTAGGNTNCKSIAKWNGGAWTNLEGGLDWVNALAVDGSGNLYAGGNVDQAGSFKFSHIAKWDGNAWTNLGYGLNDQVHALAVDRVSGVIYAGGYFDRAVDNNTVCLKIAKWDGNAWADPGSARGVGLNFKVYALTVDQHSGILYAGGGLLADMPAGGNTNCRSIAAWDGSAWTNLGSGMDNEVYALAVGPNSGHLYAGGAFITAGGNTNCNYIAKWDPATAGWTNLGSGMDGWVSALTVDGSNNLYAGGSFYTAGGVGANHIAKWDGGVWTNVGVGVYGAGEVVYALAMGTNGTLYAGGSFDWADDVHAFSIAKWDGSAWSDLDMGMFGEFGFSYVYALAVDRSSGTLYAGGSFNQAGGTFNCNNIAKWDGLLWSDVLGMDAPVQALALDGANNLYAGGQFTTAGANACNHIAKWDGSAWTNLGSGMDREVYALAVDGASGTRYAGGGFIRAGSKGSPYAAYQIVGPDRVRSSDPAHNAVAWSGTNARFGILRPLVPVSATTNNVLVYSRERGYRPAASVSVGPSNQVVWVPATNYLAGERMRLTAQASIMDNYGFPIQPFAAEFTAAVAPQGGSFDGTNTLGTNSAVNVARMAVVDWNADGALDVLVAKLGPAGFSEIRIWTNNGTGGLTGPMNLSEVSGTSFQVGDLNRDGRLDLFVTRGLPGEGRPDSAFIQTGTQRVEQVVGGDLYPSSAAALGDLDLDGDLDAVVVGRTDDPTTQYRVYLNNGNGALVPFADHVFSAPADPVDVKLGDLNGDGSLDAVIYHGDTKPGVVWLNDGTGRFAPRSQGGAWKEYMDGKRCQLGDLNGDGKLDVVVVDGNVTVRVWTNDGRATFAGMPQTLSRNVAEVEVADVNGDGVLDLVTAPPAGNVVSLWTNNGAATFALLRDLTNSAGGVTPTLGVGDVDGNGHLDLLVAHKGSIPQVRIWLNIAPPPVPAALVLTAVPGGIQADWAASPGATRYRVQSAIGGPIFGGPPSLTIGTQFTRVPLNPGDLVYVRVRAESESGFSDWVTNSIVVPGPSTSQGVPQAWLSQYYPGTTDFEGAATNDTDQDGRQAWEEYFADTSPTNAASYFPPIALTNAPLGAISAVIDPTSTARLYEVQWTTNLVTTPPLWELYGTGMTGTGSRLLFAVGTNAESSGYFRSRVRLP